jgi:acyl carrier protein
MMTQTEIHERLTGVFRDVFDNPALDISDATTAKDIEYWDSINHVTLVAAVEKEFGVSFTTRDVRRLENVGDLVQLISHRLN